jgi:hypothetical protein
MLLPVVVPYRGIRGVDGFGAGGFGAPRVHDKNGVDRTEAHLGLDLISEPGDAAICPFIEATYERFGWAYPWTRDLALVVLREAVEPRRTARVLYIAPLAGLAPGARLRAGDQIGVAQPLAEIYAARIAKRAAEGDVWARIKQRTNAKMTNHVHLGLLDRYGQPIDPSLLLVLPKEGA